MSFKKYNPLGLRIWHWLNVIVIAGLLLTAFLRKGWMSWRNSSAVILDHTQNAGTPVAPEVAKQIAIELRDQMWDWHERIGFVFAALLVLRFIVFLKDKQITQINWRDTQNWYFNSVKASYIIFYLIAFYMAGSGLLLYFEDSLGLNKDFAHLIKEIHEFMLWFFSFFIIAHGVGVFAAEIRGDKGLVSDMINGGDKK